MTVDLTKEGLMAKAKAVEAAFGDVGEIDHIVGVIAAALEEVRDVAEKRNPCDGPDGCMTCLRDDFAKAALHAMDLPLYNDESAVHGEDLETTLRCAKRAYQYADAMLAAREAPRG